MKETVSLVVAGREYRGWERVSLSAAMGAYASRLSLQATKDPQELVSAFWAGQLCELRIGDQSIFKGDITSYSVSANANGRSVQIEAESLAGRLTTGSAIDQSGQFKNMNLLQIAQRLTKPYGVPVSVSGELKQIDNYEIRDGDTVEGALRNGIMLRPRVVKPEFNGGIAFINTEQSLALRSISDRECASVSVSANTRRRHSHYIGKRGTGENASAAVVSYKDETVSGYSAKIFHLKGDISTADMRDYLAWQARQAFGNSLSVTVNYSGWRDKSGTLFWAGQKRRFSAPSVFVGEGQPIDSEMIVDSVNFNQSLSQGTVCTLRLRPAEAYESKPISQSIPKTRRSSPQAKTGAFSMSVDNFQEAANRGTLGSE